MSGLTALSGKPWDRVPTHEEVYLPRGMLGFEERRMLYWLAAEYYSGAGTIVDAGAYLGASAFALASGLAASENAGAQHAIVHSYDCFIAEDDYVYQDIARGFYPVPPGYDFYRIFEFQTALCREKIVTHRGDFLAAPVPTSSIEVLFIDVAKTGLLNGRLIERYFPLLIPGKSVVIQQDFCQAWYPYIPITMEYLTDYLTIVDSFVADSSRVYLLTQEIPEQQIKRLLSGLGVDEQITLLRRTIKKDSGLTRMMLRVAEVLLLADSPYRLDEARGAATALRGDPEFDPNAYYARQLEVVERSRQLA
jgi:hypothetical protein